MKLSDFKNKKKLKDYISDKLQNKYKTGDKIRSGEFFELLHDTIKQHYNYTELTEGGVEYFIIGLNSISNYNEFMIKNKSKSIPIAFSYKKAIEGYIPNIEHYLKRGLRKVVMKQTMDFRESYYNENSDSKGYIVCEITGLKFKIKDCHVDHKPPKTFDSLFYEFIDKYNIDMYSIKINKETFDNIPIILNKDFCNNFFNFHKENAELRCVYWRANLQQKRK